MTAIDYKSIYDRVERRIEDRYGIEVNISDVLDPNTGDFDGLRIKLDYTLDLETALFVLLHLFGHTVQWNLSEEYRKIGQELNPGVTEETLQKIFEYEKDATRYSLGLLHGVGVTNLDQWLSDWWYADWKFLKHFYTTGERLDFKTLLNGPPAETLTPLAVPEFNPQEWVSRWSF